MSPPTAISGTRTTIEKTDRQLSQFLSAVAPMRYATVTFLIRRDEKADGLFSQDEKCDGLFSRLGEDEAAELEGRGLDERLIHEAELDLLDRPGSVSLHHSLVPEPHLRGGVL